MALGVSTLKTAVSAGKENFHEEPEVFAGDPLGKFSGRHKVTKLKFWEV